MFMSVWKKKVLGGVERVFKDGKAIIDAEVLSKLPVAIRRLEPGDTIEFEDSAPLPPEMPVQKAEEKLILPKSEPKVSVLSGDPATKRRFLNGVEYWLTEEENKKYNLGKLAQAIREKADKTVEE